MTVTRRKYAFKDRGAAEDAYQRADHKLIQTEIVLAAMIAGEVEWVKRPAGSAYRIGFVRVGEMHGGYAVIAHDPGGQRISAEVRDPGHLRDWRKMLARSAMNLPGDEALRRHLDAALEVYRAKAGVDPVGELDRVGVED